MPRSSHGFQIRPAGFRVLMCGVLISVLAACATPPSPSDPEAVAEFERLNDPLEPLNRGVLAFNNVIDTMFLQPAAIFYRALTPPPIQRGVHNFLNNLGSPVIFANDLLQGEFDRAGITLGRFMVNTTVGVGGLGDVATELGLERHTEDFGQTLAVWGVPEGPFLMLPILGPSNPRDLVGFGVDTFLLDPIAWVIRANPGDRSLYGYTLAAAIAIDLRAQHLDEIADLKRTSFDFYATLRSLYRQSRRAEIYQGQPPVEDYGPAYEDIPDYEPNQP